MPLQYRAKLPAQPVRIEDRETGLKLLPGINANRKESGFYQELSMLIPSPYDKHESRAVVTVRLYSTGSRIYSCVWIHPKDGETVGGGGFAGGGGYHKGSAAMSAALERAGVQIEHKEGPDSFNATRGRKVSRKYKPGGLSGRGDSSMRQVMKALSKAAGHPRARLHVSHS